MSGFSVQGDKLKTLLKHAKKEAISFGLNPGKSVEEAVLCLHKTKAAKALGKAAKEEGKGAKISFGQVEVVDKTLRLTCLNPPLPQMAKLMKRYLKAQKIMLNVEILDADGNLLESAAEEELPDSASEAPSPDGGQAEIMKKLSDIGGRIKTLSPKMKARVIKPFQKVHGQAKAGDVKAASAGVDKIEAALDQLEKTSGPTTAKSAEEEAKSVFGEAQASPARPSKPAPGGTSPSAAKSAEEKAKSVFGEAQASPVDPMRLKSLQSRMTQITAIDVPPLMVRVKSQVLQKAKELLDSGKLDEASKLLEAFAAKVSTPRPSKPAPASAPSSPSAAKSAEEDAKSQSGDALKLTIEGTDFSDNDKMLDLQLKLSEEVVALRNLVDNKLPEKSNKKPNKMRKQYLDECTKVSGLFMKCMDARNEWYKENDEAGIIMAHKSFIASIDTKKALTKKLRELFMNDQRKHLKNESKKGKNPSSQAMEKRFGDDFLEMAQMGELQAKGKNIDPYQVTEGGVLEPMEMGEVAALYGYSTQDYTKINNILRSSGSDGPDPANKETPYIEACGKALQKLPFYKGDVVRCEKTAKYFIDEVINSGTRTEKSFLSTGPKKVTGFGDVEIHITNVKTGKEITAFSLHQTEGEVLFPPNSAFKFVKYIDENGTINNHKGLNKLNKSDTKPCQFYFEQMK